MICSVCRSMASNLDPMMAKSKTLNEESLTTLGAARLAALLMELSTLDPAVRKRLQLALAEGAGAAGLVEAVDRRLNAIAALRGSVPWGRQGAHAVELDGLRATIVKDLAKADPAGAAARLSRFIRLAPSVFRRVQDRGRFAEVFRRAIPDWVSLRTLDAPSDAAALAKDVFDLVAADSFDVCDSLIATAAPLLGSTGLDALIALAREAAGGEAPLPDGRFTENGFQIHRIWTAAADAKDDVDAFILAEVADRRRPPNVVGVVQRLLAAGRAEEALVWLNRREPIVIAPTSRLELTWQVRRLSDADHEGWKIRALVALSRIEGAQTARWRLFERFIDAQVLRDFIAAESDSRAAEIESRAFDLAFAHSSAHRAINFFTDWGRNDWSAMLIETRLDDFDPLWRRAWGVSTAQALSAEHPKAATLLYRRLVEDVLEKGESAFYPHGVGLLKACAALADHIDTDEASLAPHEKYLWRLRADRRNQREFWALVDGG